MTPWLAAAALSVIVLLAGCTTTDGPAAASSPPAGVELSPPESGSAASIAEARREYHSNGTSSYSAIVSMCDGRKCFGYTRSAPGVFEVSSNLTSISLIAEWEPVSVFAEELRVSLLDGDIIVQSAAGPSPQVLTTASLHPGEYQVRLQFAKEAGVVMDQEVRWVVAGLIQE